MQIIEYNYKTSKCEFENNLETNIISIDYHIKLQNHSKEKNSFYMKVEPPYCLDNKNMTIALDENNKTKLFTIGPKENKSLNFRFQIDDSKDFSCSGLINGPKVIIFNEKNKKIFSRSRE